MNYEMRTLPALVGHEGLFSDGDWVESKDQDPEGEIRLIQLSDVGDGVFRNRSQRFLTQQKANELNCTYLQPGDILIARMPDPLGRACIFPDVGQRAVTSVDVCIVRPLSNVDNTWLMHIVNAPQFRRMVHDLQSGTTRKRISRKNLSIIELPVPPFEEQIALRDEIDKQLTRLDAGLASIGGARSKLVHFRASFLHAAVTGSMFPNAEFIDGRVSDFADVQLGRQRSPKNHQGPNMRPYLRAANVTWDGLDLTDVKEMHFSAAEVERFQLRPGDLLLSEASGSQFEVGKAAIWNGEIDVCCFQNTLLRVRCRDVIPEYLLLVFQHAASTGAFGRAARGVGIHHLGAKALSSWPVRVPEAPIQQELVRIAEDRLSQLRRLNDDLELRERKARNIRRVVLGNAYSGDLMQTFRQDALV
jgi:type I restriction enzyme, S subunit